MQPPPSSPLHAAQAPGSTETVTNEHTPVAPLSELLPACVPSAESSVPDPPLPAVAAGCLRGGEPCG